jgi:3-hydroxyisobutyrate dehydrogenase
MRVGFIGLGRQGAPMARRIVEGGFELTLWARRPASVAPYADTGAKLAASPAELAAASDLVCLCVVGDDDVKHVLEGDTGVLAGLAPGGIVAIHSTVHPDTCREIAKGVADKGISVIDAPVSGGTHAASDGALLVMVGGDADVVARARPVFAASTLDLGESLGIPREELFDVLTRGSASSTALASIRLFGGSLDGLAPTAGVLLQKDVRHAASLADSASAPEGVVFTAADAALTSMDHPR